MLGVAQKQGDKASEAKAYHQLGVCCRSLAQSDPLAKTVQTAKALEYLAKALQIALELGNITQQAGIYQTLDILHNSLRRSNFNQKRQNDETLTTTANASLKRRIIDLTNS